jgi:hypothetical protein
MKGQVFESPRGQVLIDAQTRDIVQDMYIRKVEKKDGQLWNVEFDAIKAHEGPRQEQVTLHPPPQGERRGRRAPPQGGERQRPGKAGSRGVSLGRESLWPDRCGAC